MKMDLGIYYPTAADYGVYLTRRFPKGQGSGAGVPIGPTQPTDPNANPSTVKRSFSQVTVAPHADTIRWEYAVPMRRRAVLQDAMVDMLRDVAAAAPGGTSLSISIIRANVNELIRVVNTHIKDGAVASRNSMIHSGVIELFEGDTIRCKSSDASGDGNVSYFGTAHLIEYDAVHDVANSGSYRESGDLTSAFLPRVGGSQPMTIRSEGTPNPLLWAPIGGMYYVRR